MCREYPSYFESGNNRSLLLVVRYFMRALLLGQKVEFYRREMVRTNRRSDKEFRYERVTIDSDSDDDRSALTRDG